MSRLQNDRAHNEPASRSLACDAAALQVRVLERRILLSATWIDAETDEIVSEPTDGPEIGIGTTENDVLNGLGGDDILYGLDGDDVLSGGNGDDYLFGDAGDDYIVGGRGNDVLSGGAGDDVFGFIGIGTGLDTIDGGEGFDVVQGGRWGDTLYVSDNLSNLVDIERIDGGGGWDRIVATAGDDVLDFSQIELDNIEELNAGSGDDTVIGTSGDDYIVGGRGNDVLSGGAGDDRIDGGLGDNDVVVFSGARRDYEVTQNEDGTFTVVDTTGSGGTDQIRNIETFQFSDGTFDRQSVLEAPEPSADEHDAGGEHQSGDANKDLSGEDRSSANQRVTGSSARFDENPPTEESVDQSAMSSSQVASRAEQAVSDLDSLVDQALGSEPAEAAAVRTAPIAESASLGTLAADEPIDTMVGAGNQWGELPFEGPEIRLGGSEPEATDTLPDVSSSDLPDTEVALPQEVATGFAQTARSMFKWLLGMAWASGARGGHRESIPESRSKEDRD